MRNNEINNIRSLKSDPIRQMAEHLLETGHRVTYFGMVWTEQTGYWVYFDTVLDIEALKKHFQLGDNIIIHENLDERSGTERGFIDTNTGEGIMGRLK